MIPGATLVYILYIYVCINQNDAMFFTGSKCQEVEVKLSIWRVTITIRLMKYFEHDVLGSSRDDIR